MMVMIMRGHKFETAITAFGLSRVSALASSMANILTPSHRSSRGMGLQPAARISVLG
jgi:hypothetical protein